MEINKISLPEAYTVSQDFRFFCEWFEQSLQEVKYDIENIFDLYDPLRCKSDLLWLLADTMGYRYDDRLSVAFNRLVLIYFMSMIYHRGSRNGMILAAETNLAQFKLNMVASGYTDSSGTVHPENKILYDRLEDTSIPSNSVSVTPHPKEGYIDLVYFSEEMPIDACIEYVRPVGMFLFPNVGVTMGANTKIFIDARLTDSRDMKMSIGPTFVGHYSRNDYARMQKANDSNEPLPSDSRQPVWYRNTVSESAPNPKIHPGFRALSSLQLANNEETVMSLVPKIFSLGFGPQEIGITYPDSYLKNADPPNWNLRYDYTTDSENTPIAPDGGLVVGTLDKDSPGDIVNPNPAVNPIMSQLGDPMSE